MLRIRDIVTTRDTSPHDNNVTSLSTEARGGEGETGGVLRTAEDRMREERSIQDKPREEIITTRHRLVG